MKQPLILLISICGLWLLGCGSGGHTSPATHFSVVPATTAATAGSALNIIVTALTATNSVATGYSGSVHFTSSDGQAALPTNSTLTNGVGTFPVTLKTAGAQTVTATDTVTAISGTSGSINVSSGAATHLSVSAPTSDLTGNAFNITVTALDASNNVVMNYSGTVHFTSTDPQALLPGNSMLTGGAGTFSVTLKTVGTETVTATDTVSASINGTSNSINLTATAALQITSGSPPAGTVGDLYDGRRGGRCRSGSAGCVCIIITGIGLECFIDLHGFPLTATGGVQPYTWSWTAAPGSSLPPGLTVSDALIDGTPTAAASYSVIVTVTDSASAHASADYTITIAAPAEAKSADVIAPDVPHGHHHYKLVDIGTFGGPQSYINGFEYHGAVQTLNNAGTLTGWADTSMVDPFCSSGNAFGNFCFNFDQPPACFGAIGCPGHVSHAFEWRDGVRTDLEVLPGGLSAATSWISANGLIAGTSQNGETDPLDPGFPEDQAVLWKNGNIINLGTLPEGGFESGAQAVNSRGQVVGWALNTVSDQNSMALLSSLFNFYEPIYPFQTRAFLWQNGVMQDLGTLGTGTDAFAMAINEQAQVIGISYTNSTPNAVTTQCSTGPIPTQDPFLWENDEMIDLGTLGGTCGLPSWINNFGEVVGSSDLAGDQNSHAFLWTKWRGMQDLGTLGGSSAGPAMINDLGEVVGESLLAGDNQGDAFLWSHGTMHDLGTIQGCAAALAINLRSQVVGNWGDFPNCDAGAFLWEHGGPIVDLSTLISPPTKLSVLVIGINDRGEIAGNADNANDIGHAILLIPCDENHPGIEGCDYSLVDSATVVEAHPANITTVPAVAANQPKLSSSEMLARFSSLRAGGNRRNFHLDPNAPNAEGRTP